MNFAKRRLDIPSSLNRLGQLSVIGLLVAFGIIKFTGFYIS